MSCVITTGGYSLGLGCTVYILDTANSRVSSQTVCAIHLCEEDNLSYILTKYPANPNSCYEEYVRKHRLCQMGKTVFTTFEDASNALCARKGIKNGV